MLSAIPLLFLEELRLAAGAPVSWDELIGRWIFVVALLLTARLGQPYSLDGARWGLPWLRIVVAAVGVLAWLMYANSNDTRAAWIALAALYAGLLGLDAALAKGQAIWRRWGMHLVLALVAGTLPVAAAQIESRFAEEEFFVALQALALAGFWFVLLIVWRWFWGTASAHARRGVGFNPGWVGGALLLVGIAGLVFTVRSYQDSFYPPQAPVYQGISTSTPFLCGQVLPDARTFDDKDVFHRLLARVEANPYKRAPEYSMLALGSGEERWAQNFRASLLGEAAQGLFTGPVNSVKSAQYEAALRVYYFANVRRVFPNLFTGDEEAKLRQWFGSINRRALTVEWVDWMYALAFVKWPEGLYENQENGAGLLALLESQGLAAPDLSPMNQSYLERNRRGWATRFRNTDDALIYQPEWINNAFFQSLYTGESPQQNIRFSFEWLLLQALPDGAPLGYNHPGSTSLAGIAYLGARLLGDVRYIWLSGQALADAESRGAYLFAQPGVEQALGLPGRSPRDGSCLLYGDSGLPNQVGPLAPDKIAFRDGWSDEATYLLLNLRFTGWHRYKATNAIISLYQNGPLITEKLERKPFDWLPVGRSLFRDKRIPRENLNGLLIERAGMSAVLYALIGVGGPWAQDPPYYARVKRFETTAEMDVSTTVVEGWHGWRHVRTVYFYHRGPIVVVDEAKGPAGDRAALIWHFAGEAQAQGQRIWLRGGEQPVDMLLLPIGDGEIEAKPKQVTFSAPANGQLGLVTLFLLGEWVGAEAGITQGAGQPILQIVREGKRISVPLSGDKGVE